MQQLSADKLVKDLEKLVADAEEFLKATAGNANEAITAAQVRAEECLLAMRPNLTEHKEQRTPNSAPTNAKQVVDKAAAYLHDNTWKLMGISAGAGAVLGLLLNHHHRHVK